MKLLARIVFAGLFWALPVFSQGGLYPDTLWVPVTFYDFHSNGSNPEFEPSHETGDLIPNMVQNTLDGDNKPVLRIDPEGKYPGQNYYLKYWYRPWNSPGGGSGDKTIPTYTCTGNCGQWWDADVEFDGVVDVPYDTAFKNIVIKDSLPFLHLGRNDPTQTGVYRYLNDYFFPLDGLGFGNESRDQKNDVLHNFSFSMELHWKFTMVPGLTFSFMGDDDVWCFIDGQLRMDLGGIHGPENGSFQLDDIPGLVEGREYSLDFFYAERHTDDAHIRITTNIISAIPTNIELQVFPNDTIRAGDTLTAISIVRDQNDSIRAEFGDRTEWEFVNSGGNAESTLFPRTGSTVKFVPTEAHTWVTIAGTVEEGGTVIRDSIRIYVLPGPADHLVIEAIPNPTGSALRDDNPLDVLVIPSDRASGNAYAVLRDRYGNFISASQSTAWSIASGSAIIDRAVPGTQTEGQGIVYKKGPQGEGEVMAASNTYSGDNFKDRLRVVVDNVTYSALRIVVNSGGSKVKIDSLTTTTDICTLLMVEGNRTDGLGWEPVPGKWQSSIETSIDPPDQSQSWNYCASDTGRGSIGVVYAGKNTQIPVKVLPGGPAKLKLYSSVNGQEYTDPPAYYLDSAGNPFPLYAKVFDKNDVWLTQYNNSDAPITWTIGEISGTPPTGAYLLSQGQRNEFTPTRAYNVVHLIATFENGRFADSVRVRVVPGQPDHITIQADTASINGWRKLTRIEFQSTEITRNAFAVIRDRYENFVSYAENSNWLSRDTVIVGAVSSTNPFYGEGIMTRKTDNNSDTWVVANSADNRFRDSVQVFMTNITYDSLRIYTPENRYNLDTIRIRTDEVDTLWVEGKRSDGLGWDLVPATWSLTGTLKTVGLPPIGSESWAIVPDSLGTGKIIASLAGAVPDTIVGLFIPGLPGSMRLYRAEGNPAGISPYSLPPIVDTINAGSTYPFVAKIFDRKSVWLPGYESASVSRSLINWSISLLSGFAQPDTLNSRAGHIVTFSPKKAYNTYAITAEFREGSRVYSATVHIYVKYGPVDHLVIEGSSTPSGVFLSQDNPLSTIDFGSRDTIKAAYAILRDANGNYVMRSQSTSWTSLNTALVTASEGVATLGEGRVRRLGTLGNTKIVAVNRNTPSLFDTVDVAVSDFSIDSLRIVVNNTQRIDSLVMRSDQDTTLQVQGKRSYDGQWVPVDGNWNYTSTGVSIGASSTSMWDFAPGDTGTGKIIVTMGSSVPDTVYVKIRPGLPVKIALYAREGQVPDASNPPYQSPELPINVTAGEAFPVVAKVFDHKNVWLAQYELETAKSNQIHWKLEEMPGKTETGVLDDTTGHENSFMPDKAYQTVTIIANFRYDASRVYSDSVKVTVVPGSPKNLFLEGSPDWQSRPNDPNPVDTVQIPDNARSTRVYAVLRDARGNFVRFATIDSWGVVDDTIIVATNGNTSLGEGIIERKGSDGIAVVYGVDTAGFRDSVVVKLLGYHYTDLRILSGKTPIESLVMNTNQDTTIRVQGFRSDTTVWEDFTAGRWANSSSLKMEPSAPGSDRLWSFSPTDTGTGIIWVSDPQGVATADTIDVRFTPGPLTRVVVEVLTPPEQRIAGEPISIVVKIYNEDGLVPGDTCFYAGTGEGVRYSDTLGTGGRPRPFVMIAGDTIWLSRSGDQCFSGGLDTVPTTLFYVPSDPDSLHQISVNIGGFNAKTDPFWLFPGALDSLALQYPDGTPVGDSVVLRFPTGGAMIYAYGYDRYGNKRGPEKSNWDTDSTLHDIQQGTNQERIWYDASGVKDNEYGKITAAANDSVKASTFVKIIGPLVTVASAVTGDDNGNGYLDRITLRFSKAVTLPDNFAEIADLVISYGKDVSFTVDSIIGGSKGADTVWTLLLDEQTEGKTPQTNWKPYISFDAIPDAGIDSVSKFVAEDGAGPVIWKVTKEIKPGENNSEDVITVVFSETVMNKNGNKLNIDDIPSVMLYVWEKDPEDASKFIRIDSMLVGIDNLQTADDSKITFTTENEVDLTTRHFVSIKMAGDSSYITDQVGTGNFPDPDNQLVRVQLLGIPGPDLNPFPNPATATARRVSAGVINARHEPNARTWVKTDRSGVVLNFDLMVPPAEENLKVKCIIKIYDAVGNQVITNTNNDLLGDERISKSDLQKSRGSLFDIDLYWNGFTGRKMKAAPGIYKVMVYLEYYGSKSASEYNKNFKPLIDNVGIGHSSTK
ncbi:MAG: fibro-slime domain-containing protein [Fibrobacter sp.]|nr:fibro-slime domain-containing protein [Fibrobacter sp.]